MARSDARQAMACPSPGRSRMVMRSVAGVLGPVALGSRQPESGMERMTARAMADSDTLRERARLENHSLSRAERRTVIDGSGVRAERHLMWAVVRCAANADTPLSCPRRNFFPVQSIPSARMAL